MSDRTYAKVQTQQKTLSGSSPKSGLLQRTCACGKHTIAGGECEACHSEQSTLLRSQRAFGPPSAPGAVAGSSPAQEHGTAFNSAFDSTSRFGHDFSRIPIHSPATGALQTKLTVNHPRDEYEQEADRIADQVMATPTHHAISGTPPSIQRFSEQSNGPMDTVPASVDQALASPGRPLEPVLRQDMEQRFGHDFSQVRVHSGASAEQAAQDVNAKAYTVEHDMVFGTGQFAPGTHEGRRLIAHELTHVLQQSRSGGIGATPPGDIRGLSSSLAIGPAGDSHEQEAHRISDQVMDMAKSPLHRISTAPHALQREMGGGFTEPFEVRNMVLKQVYKEFVKNAMIYGLPVKFLADVSRITSMRSSDENVYNATFGWLNLKTEAVVSARDLAPTQKVSPTLEIQTIYHESTHAYLYEHRNEEPFKQFYVRGTQHYEGAPTKQGRITSDPERVFQEACAVYVGNRAQAWWVALSQLTRAIANPLSPTLSMLDDIRANYDSVMAQRIIGYSEEGGWFSKTQVPTTRPIAEEMKSFLDRELLENKIPDKFDQVVAFKELFAEATAIAKGAKVLRNRWR